jgi:hypothetical protein
MQIGKYVWEMRNLSKILVDQSERKEQVSKLRGRWVIDVNMELSMNGAGIA